VGLRDQRQQALTDLAKLVGIRVVEQETGSVNIYCGSTYLVYGGTAQKVETVMDTVNDRTVAEIHYAGSDAKLDTSSGELAGVTTARDDVLGAFADSLDTFSQTLATEFNKVYSSGQGLQGYDSLTSQSAVDSADAALNAAGLPSTPVNGSFQLQVYDTTTKETTATGIGINLSGVGQQTTLNSLAAALNNVLGVKASVSKDGKLTIESLNSDCQLAFSNDTSGVLAALGLNTFFTGTSALNLDVNQAVQDNPATLAASTAGIGSDTTNATTLANFADVKLESQGGKTLSYLYDSLVSNVTQASSVAQSEASSSATFQSTLSSQETAVSGVNIDEEAVNMMAYQRAYQACAKYISTINDLLDTLLKM
jgi:flagellar hook-associated protein 1